MDCGIELLSWVFLSFPFQDLCHDTWCSRYQLIRDSVFFQPKGFSDILCVGKLMTGTRRSSWKECLFSNWYSESDRTIFSSIVIQFAQTMINSFCACQVCVLQSLIAQVNDVYQGHDMTSSWIAAKIQIPLSSELFEWQDRIRYYFSKVNPSIALLDQQCYAYLDQESLVILLSYLGFLPKVAVEGRIKTKQMYMHYFSSNTFLANAYQLKDFLKLIRFFCLATQILVKYSLDPM